jgi:hypothetical protein
MRLRDTKGQALTADRSHVAQTKRGHAMRSFDFAPYYRSTVGFNRLFSMLDQVGGVGPATMAHFHGPATEGKNGPPVIWLKEKGAAVESPIRGDATLTPEQAQQFAAGEWYINVHTQANQGGEIRGQVMPPKN